MFLVFAFLWVCHLGCEALNDTKGHRTGLRNRWYGPSYQPKWWNADGVLTLRASTFSYSGDNGPSHWSTQFPDCGGESQSPINIETEYLKKRKTRKPLKWSNYDSVPGRMVVENSGHSIHVNGIWKNSSEIPFIRNGPLEKRYYFSQLHFHWGRDSSAGSEHNVNRKSFPLEMHVVHDRHVEDPTNLSEEGDSDELVVVAYMFEVVKNDNDALKPILDATKEVQGNTRKKTYVKPFPIDDIVEPFPGDYVTYKGSLTTPPCTEGVIWIVNSKPLGISERQLAILRRSVTGSNGRAISNYRPVQGVNGRNVYYVFC